MLTVYNTNIGGGRYFHTNCLMEFLQHHWAVFPILFHFLNQKQLYTSTALCKRGTSSYHTQTTIHHTFTLLYIQREEHCFKYSASMQHVPRRCPPKNVIRNLILLVTGHWIPSLPSSHIFCHYISQIAKLTGGKT